jgi:hypothetical protein
VQAAKVAGDGGCCTPPGDFIADVGSGTLNPSRHRGDLFAGHTPKPAGELTGRPQVIVVGHHRIHRSVAKNLEGWCA